MIIPPTVFSLVLMFQNTHILRLTYQIILQRLQMPQSQSQPIIHLYIFGQHTQTCFSPVSVFSFSPTVVTLH